MRIPEARSWTALTALARRDATKHQLPFEVLYDKTGDAAEKYDVPGTSYIVVVNRAGKVVYTGVGGDQNIDAAVRKAPCIQKALRPFTLEFPRCYIVAPVTYDRR